MKENNGDLSFNAKPPSSNAKRRRPHNNSRESGESKLLLSLLAGAGAAFLLAILLLASRLDAPSGNGEMDAFVAEEVAQGRASPALMMRKRMAGGIEKLKRRYEGKLDKFHKLAGGQEGPLDELVHEAVGELTRIEDAMDGRGGDIARRAPLDLKKEFVQRLKEGEGRNKRHNQIEEPHLYPRLPPLPPHLMAVDLFGPDIVSDTLAGSPTVAGIIAILQAFLAEVHAMEVEKKHATAHQVVDAYFSLVDKHLHPLEEAYRSRPLFDVREDESIFMSLGAYRDHLLGETLRQAFLNAKCPDKLFVGAVVQNCFGLGVQCRTGVEVVGTNQDGSPKTAISDRPPDVNGIEEFCTDPLYTKYCDNGQIRALYVNETESNGPTTARYFASKLWGGETYFLQADAHLRFAPDWDVLYQQEVKATKSYPKAVLSSYPPGFSQDDPPYKGGSKGTRLCTCEFSMSDVEHKIIRINTGNNCRGEEEHPTQIAYIAAGFFFARAEFLVDVPFDPYLPWCFMGEEIALSLRAWTNGWDIYAPRKNLIAHQYRPGRMGLPKFWENTGRVFGRPGPGFNTELQTITLQRIKHMVGYEEATLVNLENHGNSIVMTDYEHYGPGEVRTVDAFLEHTRIDVKNFKCGHIDWCNECTLD